MEKEKIIVNISGIVSAGKNHEEVIILTKSRVAIFVLILTSLLLMLSLAGCASETPVAEPETPAGGAEAPEAGEAEPEPVVPSFEASKYVDTEYGFSVQYPAVWVENPVTEGSTIALYVVSEDRVPLMFVNVDKAATFEEALEGAITAAEGSNVEIDSQEEVRLAGGINATRAIFKFKHPDAPFALDAMVLGTQKDGQWITIVVATLGLISKFDEPLFTEIVSTLSFE